MVENVSQMIPPRRSSQLGHCRKIPESSCHCAVPWRTVHRKESPSPFLKDPGNFFQDMAWGWALAGGTLGARLFQAKSTGWAEAQR